MSPNPGLRASDDDRERVVSQLGDHLAAGRLDTGEFEERMSAAYAATTLGELEVLMTDLPSEPPSPATTLDKPAPEPQAPVAHGSHGRWRHPYGSWLSVSLICTAVWGMSSLAADQLLSFWPMWVIGPWGVVLLAGKAGTRFGGGRARD